MIWTPSLLPSNVLKLWIVVMLVRVRVWVNVAVVIDSFQCGHQLRNKMWARFRLRFRLRVRLRV